MTDDWERPLCTAKSKRSGGRCRRAPTRGARVYYYHGGAVPAVKRAAARRLEEIRVRGELGRLLEELELGAADAHPITALTEALTRCRAMTAVLGALVPNGSLYKGDRPHPLAAMYAEWVANTTRVAKACLDAAADGEFSAKAANGQRLQEVVLGRGTRSLRVKRPATAILCTLRPTYFIGSSASVAPMVSTHTLRFASHLMSRR